MTFQVSYYRTNHLKSAIKLQKKDTTKFQNKNLLPFLTKMESIHDASGHKSMMDPGSEKRGEKRDRSLLTKLVPIVYFFKVGNFRPLCITSG